MNKKYNLRVQIGKKPIAAGLKKRVYRFQADTMEDLAKELITINIPKMMEECFFTLEFEGKKRDVAMNAMRARRIFNNELNAFFFIKLQLPVVK
ncbi:MAG: hypothetical protein U9O65_10610 [Thermotogota bacterium]|nr:hypothetical protein [Thermotogota bacterium]